MSLALNELHEFMYPPDQKWRRNPAPAHVHHTDEIFLGLIADVIKRLATSASTSMNLKSGLTFSEVYLHLFCPSSHSLFNCVSTGLACFPPHKGGSVWPCSHTCFRGQRSPDLILEVKRKCVFEFGVSHEFHGRWISYL